MIDLEAQIEKIVEKHKNHFMLDKQVAEALGEKHLQFAKKLEREF